jgi:hypothetical protein
MANASKVEYITGGDQLPFPPLTSIHPHQQIHIVNSAHIAIMDGEDIKHPGSAIESR